MGKEAPLVERLGEASNPRDMLDWDGKEGYYVATCRVSKEDVPGLVEIVRQWNDPNWLEDAAIPPGEERDDVELLPVTAWRALADLKAEDAVEPLVEMLAEMDDDVDDWTSEELPCVFGKIGEAAIEPLARLARNRDAGQFVRSTAVRGLSRVAQNHKNTRDRIVAMLTEMMADAANGDIYFNTSVLTELVDLKAVEAAEPIERAFSLDLLDSGMMGDWEDVRKELGVEGLGLPMPARPYNSLDGMRNKMGVGIFSDRAIFVLGDIDHDAEETYYRRACDAFAQSSEGQQCLMRRGELSWVPLFLEYGVQYEGMFVDTATLEDIKGFLFDFVPRKVSAEAECAAAIVDELTAFWTFLGRVYKLPEAESIIAWLQTEGLVARLKRAMSDSSNFGMAKSFFNLGNSAGFDMTSQEGLDDFMEAYNQSLPASASEAPSTIRSTQPRVGRNEPCPCGSGKKFKKCCLREKQNDQ